MKHLFSAPESSGLFEALGFARGLCQNPRSLVLRCGALLLLPGPLGPSGQEETDRCSDERSGGLSVGDDSDSTELSSYIDPRVQWIAPVEFSTRVKPASQERTILQKLLGNL